MNKIHEFSYEFYIASALLLFIFIILIFCHKRKIVFHFAKKFQFHHILLSWKYAFRVVTSGFDTSLVEVLENPSDEGYLCINLVFLKYVILYHPDYVKVLLTNKDNINKSMIYRGFKDLVGDALLLRSDSDFKERKRILLPAFHSSVMHSFLPVMEDNVRKMVQIMREKKEVSISLLVRRCIFDIIYDTILGIGNDSDFKKNNIYHSKILNETLRPLTDRGLNWFLFSDIIFNLTSKGKSFERNKKILRNISKEIVKEKLRLRNEDVSNGDNKKLTSLLDLMLDERDKDPEITLNSIYEEMELFLIAASDSTSLTVIWALYLLGHHPEVQKRIQDEIDEVLGNDNQKFISSEDLYKMKYLECAVNETMRLYPAVPNISRKVSKDIFLGSKYYSKDWTFIVSIFHLHRNPNIYENPEKFFPERFLPENSLVRSPYAFIPFSAGSRMCIGYRLAMMEVKLVLATILRKLNVECMNKVESLYFKITLNPVGSIRARFKSRNS